MSRENFTLAVQKLAAAGLEFSGSDFRAMLGPVVYVWVREDRALYVGMSRHGLSRALSPKHHRLGALDLRESDALLVYACASTADAQELERLLIRTLRPERNGQRLLRAPLAALLGLTPARAGAIVNA